jgi:hypothetical protein
LYLLPLHLRITLSLCIWILNTYFTQLIPKSGTQILIYTWCFMLNRHVHFSITFSFIRICSTPILLFGLYCRFLSSLFVFWHSTILTFHFHFVFFLDNDFQNALHFVLLSHKYFTHISWTGDVSQDDIEHMLVLPKFCKYWDDSHVTPWLQKYSVFIFPISHGIVSLPMTLKNTMCVFKERLSSRFCTFSLHCMMCLLSWINFLLL